MAFARSSAPSSLEAAAFLAAKVAEGKGGKTVYDMIDVLKEGGMVTN